MAEIDYTRFKDSEGEPVARRAHPLALPRDEEDDDHGSVAVKIAEARARAKGGRKTKAAPVESASLANPEHSARIAARDLSAGLREATVIEDRAHAQQLRDAKAMLQPTIKAAERIAEEVLRFKRAWGDWIAEVRAFDFTELLAMQGGAGNQAAVARNHIIIQKCDEALRMMNNLPFQMTDIAKAVQKLNVLTPSIGNASRTEAQMGGGFIEVRDIQLAVSRQSAALQTLQEIRAILEVHVRDLGTRIAQIREGAKQPTSRTVLIGPEEMELREALRPSPPTRFAANSGDGTHEADADWNPLDPASWRR